MICYDLATYNSVWMAIGGATGILITFGLIKLFGLEIREKALEGK